MVKWHFRQGGVTPIGTVYRAATGVKIFDRRKMALDHTPLDPLTYDTMRMREGSVATLYLSINGNNIGPGILLDRLTTPKKVS